MRGVAISHYRIRTQIQTRVISVSFSIYRSLVIGVPHKLPFTHIPHKKCLARFNKIVVAIWIYHNKLILLNHSLFMICCSYISKINIIYQQKQEQKKKSRKTANLWFHKVYIRCRRLSLSFAHLLIPIFISFFSPPRKFIPLSVWYHLSNLTNVCIWHTFDTKKDTWNILNFEVCTANENRPQDFRVERETKTLLLDCQENE